MSEKITVVNLKEIISKNPFYSCPWGGDIWTKIFPSGRAFGQWSCPRSREFDQQQFQKFKCLGVAGEGGMLKFQIDRYIKDQKTICKLLFIHYFFYQTQYNKHNSTYLFGS